MYLVSVVGKIAELEKVKLAMVKLEESILKDESSWKAFCEVGKNHDSWKHNRMKLET